MEKVAGRRRRVAGFSALVWAGAIVGCPNEELAPIEPCTVSGVADTVSTQGVDEVDLLFMIDNSGSMKEEQELLAQQLPILARVLASGTLDLGGGNVRTFTPVRSLHLGVVSSDMGLSGAVNTTAGPCDQTLGDDGKLLIGAMQACPLTTVASGNHLSFTKGETDVEALGNEFACISNLGTEGCGLEQQLEAMLKAVAPASDTSFSTGSGGHRDGRNTDFLRAKSVIALIAVTDEEDCSIPDSSNQMFVRDPSEPRFIALNQKPVGVNSRCAAFANSGMLHPISRYVKGFQDLRPDNPDLVIFGAIAGIPEDAEDLPTVDGAQNFDGILALEGMKYKFGGIEGITSANVERVTTAKSGNGELPDHACQPIAGPEDAGASPARRFVEVAKAFGKNGIIRSICASSFASAMSAIVDKIADRLSGACLKRTLNPNDQGIVECDIVEYLPADIKECDSSKGRRPADPPSRKDKNGVERTVCKVDQVAVKKDNPGCSEGAQDPVPCLAPNPTPDASQALVGWYYDDFTSGVKTACEKEQKGAQRRIGFTPDAEPSLGSEIRFECLQPVFTVSGEPEGKNTVNKQCKGAPYVSMSLADLAGEAGVSPDCESDEEYPVVRCQPTTNTCQIMCEADAGCPDAWVCNKPTGNQLGFCVNPTCPI